MCQHWKLQQRKTLLQLPWHTETCSLPCGMHAGRGMVGQNIRLVNHVCVLSLCGCFVFPSSCGKMCVWWLTFYSLFSACLTGQHRSLLSDQLAVHGDPQLGRSVYVCLCVCVCASAITWPHLYIPTVSGFIDTCTQSTAQLASVCACVGVCVCAQSRLSFKCVCTEGECADCSALVLGMPIRSGYKSWTQCSHCVSSPANEWILNATKKPL